MPTVTFDEADQIIFNHASFAGASGFLPIPILDVAAITVIQTDMAKQLCALYDVPYDHHQGKSIATAMLSAFLGRIPGYGLYAMFKKVPVVGWIAGGTALSFLAGASTYAAGSVMKEHFRQGGTLNNLNPEQFRAFYRQQSDRGQALLRQWWRGENGAGPNR